MSQLPDSPGAQLRPLLPPVGGARPGAGNSPRWSWASFLHRALIGALL